MRDGCHGSRGRYYWEPGQPNIYCSTTTTTTTTAYPQIRQLTLSNKWAAWCLIVIPSQKLEVLIKYFQIHPELLIFLKKGEHFFQNRQKTAQKSEKICSRSAWWSWAPPATSMKICCWRAAMARLRRQETMTCPTWANGKIIESKVPLNGEIRWVPREGPLTYFAFGRWTKKVEYWGISR